VGIIDSGKSINETVNSLLVSTSPFHPLSPPEAGRLTKEKVRVRLKRRQEFFDATIYR
jgi:hypothetical protein